MIELLGGVKRLIFLCLVFGWGSKKKLTAVACARSVTDCKVICKHGLSTGGVGV